VSHAVGVKSLAAKLLDELGVTGRLCGLEEESQISEVFCSTEREPRWISKI
jgi:hypothetical protein